jgi:multidrug resistance efflux pump
MSAEPVSRAPARPPEGPPLEDLDAPSGEPPPAARRSRRSRRFVPVAVTLVILAGALVGYLVWRSSQTVEIEEANVTGPQVSLQARAGGTLKQVYSAVGDEVRAHRPIARVGNEVVTSDVPGRVMWVRDDLGSFIPPGTRVAGLVLWDDLRAVGRIDEDNGLSDLRIGQRARVEVDAFGSRDFPGWVEEISALPASQDIRFNISDKREERQYEVKVRFDGKPDPNLRQGMSARIWVEK